MRSATTAILTVFILSGCDLPPERIEPIVSQFNGDSVSIQLDGMSLEMTTPETRTVVNRNADVKAQEICQRGHKKRAEYTSSRRIPTGQYTYVVERLYLCLT
jgi:hypothetical protein